MGLRGEGACKKQMAYCIVYVTNKKGVLTSKKESRY